MARRSTEPLNPSLVVLRANAMYYGLKHTGTKAEIAARIRASGEHIESASGMPEKWLYWGAHPGEYAKRNRELMRAGKAATKTGRKRKASKTAPIGKGTPHRSRRKKQAVTIPLALKEILKPLPRKRGHKRKAS